MVNLINGDCLIELDKQQENSIDSIVTDPPYELNFMGKGWDNAGVSFQKETWEKCLRVLKPGGYLLAFGGSRTFHRIACAIEDAGFEIRDTIMWLYGGGFPYTKNSKRNSSYNKDTEYTNTYTPPKAIYTDNNTYGDSGSACRYFYCAKASKKDRDEGLDTFSEEKVNDGRQTPIDNPFQRGETPRKNTHPTVKPTELMQYLVRLVTPKGGTVLDPFMR